MWFDLQLPRIASYTRTGSSGCTRRWQDASGICKDTAVHCMCRHFQVNHVARFNGHHSRSTTCQDCPPPIPAFGHVQCPEEVTATGKDLEHGTAGCVADDHSTWVIFKPDGADVQLSAAS